MLLLKALLLKIENELIVQPSTDADGKRIIKRLNGLKEQISVMLFNLSEDEKDDFVEGVYFPTKGKIKYLNGSISEKYANDMNVVLLGNDFDSINNSAFQIYRRQKDNRYTNFF